MARRKILFIFKALKKILNLAGLKWFSAIFREECGLKACVLYIDILQDMLDFTAKPKMWLGSSLATYSQCQRRWGPCGWSSCAPWGPQRRGTPCGTQGSWWRWGRRAEPRVAAIQDHAAEVPACARAEGKHTSPSRRRESNRKDVWCEVQWQQKPLFTKGSRHANPHCYYYFCCGDEWTIHKIIKGHTQTYANKSITHTNTYITVLKVL